MKNVMFVSTQIKKKNPIFSYLFNIFISVTKMRFILNARFWHLISKSAVFDVNAWPSALISVVLIWGDFGGPSDQTAVETNGMSKDHSGPMGHETSTTLINFQM